MRLITKLCLTLPLVATTMGASLQAQDEDRDVFFLDAFVVDGSEQRGYVATTSMSGTRLNQLVKDLPIPIDIITEDFIRDTGALTIGEALQYTAGLETEITSQQVGENPSRTGTSFRLRGFVSQAVLRNGFRREGASDTINVSQVDVIRGPNALLYGIGNFGGVVNYVTKVPRDEFAASASVVLGRWDFYRFQADVSGPVNDKLGYRVPFMYQENKNWFDYASEERRGIAPVFVYKFTEKTRVQVELDYYKTSRRNAEEPLTANFRSVDSLPFIDTTLHPGNLGFLARPNNGFRYTGPDRFSDQEDLGVLVQLTHVFSEQLGLNVGYYWTETRLDGLNPTVNLGPIPSILSPDLLGQINRARYPWAWNPVHEMYDDWSAEQFYALEYLWNKSESVRERQQARFEFAYRPEWFGLNHTFMFGVSVDRVGEQVTPWQLKDTSRPQGITSSDYTGFQSARTRYHSINNFDPIRFSLGETEAFMQTADARRSFIGNALGSYLIHQTAFFDDRLRTILGMRFDRFQVTSENRYTIDESLDLVGDNSLAGRLKPFKTSQPATQEVNYSVGLSYSPTQDISVFVLTASALDPEVTGGQRTPDGLIPSPQSGQSYEIGSKIDFLDGRISGSFSAYTVTRENVVVDAAIINRPPDSVVESERWLAEGRGSPGGKALRKDRSSGFDAQVFLINLIPNFETILTFSYNKYEILDAVFLVYQGLGDDGSFLFDRINARENIGIVEGLEQLPWDDSRLNNDTPKYSFRVWNKYTFRDNFLEGLDIGVGVRWTDRREASFGFFDNQSYKIIPDRLTVDLAMGYLLRIRDNEINLRLNISNLLNDDKVYGYRFTEPRRWRLTASMNF